ncbi:MFS transporter [Brevibacillus choshinensis]|uniref:MFS transporter n=1 Tax=Brevibacillus choshinensis TaxID=54911 RepID=A0ABR5N989_BRECH|nr:MFS transporter [Brevibacillus choshinensis]KQL47009.1 MFS transporter [Brevibacillus choshinensis]
MSFMQLHPNIRIRIVTSFLTRVVGTMIFPFMAIYFSDKLGQAVAGFLLFANVCAQILMGFYGGYLADRWGRKKVMVYGEVAQCIAFILMALANSPILDSAWLTFAMMLVQNASNGMIGPAADAMLIDVSTKENRTFMYSINYWAVNLSIAIGSVLGGIWFATHRFELIVGLTVVSLFTLVLTVFFMQESYHPQIRNTHSKPNMLKDVFTSYRQVMKDQRFLLFSLGGLLIFSLEFQTANYVAVRLTKEFHTQTVHMGNLFSFELTGLKVFSFIQLENTLLVVCLSLLVSKLIRHGREANAMYMGVLLFIMGYSIISYSNSLFVITIAMFFATFGELLHIPTRQTYLAQIVRDDARSSYMAVNGLVFQGAKLTGTIGISLGAILPSMAMSILFLVMGLTGLLLVRRVLLQLDQRTSLSLSHAKGATD